MAVDHSNKQSDVYDKLAELQREALNEAKLFDTLFSSPVGERVLKILEDEFDHSPICLPDGSSRGDSIRAAQVDVITFIRLNIEKGKGNEDAVR